MRCYRVALVEPSPSSGIASAAGLAVFIVLGLVLSASLARTRTV